VPRRWARE